MPSLMLVPLALPKEIKQTDRQTHKHTERIALYILDNSSVEVAQLLRSSLQAVTLLCCKTKMSKSGQFEMVHNGNIEIGNQICPG